MYNILRSKKTLKIAYVCVTCRVSPASGACWRHVQVHSDLQKCADGDMVNQCFWFLCWLMFSILCILWIHMIVILNNRVLASGFSYHDVIWNTLRRFFLKEQPETPPKRYPTKCRIMSHPTGNSRDMCPRLNGEEETIFKIGNRACAWKWRSTDWKTMFRILSRPFEVSIVIVRVLSQKNKNWCWPIPGWLPPNLSIVYMSV